ncbi:aminoglycoside phosphotransferase family protein [Alcaligenes sp. SDU_A2]|uniref:aminoglycoside phosphotransferase family protein n=1 Tax=Alcaligenes sp. SDU_A2 TaxID=3136634 RepID=UPI002BE54D8A|nr:phosphotransferase [Alcaligenes sp.]HRL27229.1 phosphotransferase [Alcaligenes sp.]
MSVPFPSTADQRLQQAIAWLTPLKDRHGLQLDTLQPASSDASFRRYFRLQAADRSLILMDAPPATEDCGPFLHVTQLLAPTGIHVPDIIAVDREHGFMLLSDLGQDNFYHALQAPMEQQALDQLYRNTLLTLVKMQQADITGLPPYDEARLLEELQVFPEWYVQRYRQIELSDKEKTMLTVTFNELAKANVQSATVLVHRDFHSPNLMMPLPGQSEPGVIDYQDALAGPITYDIASLVMDARHTWPEEQQLDWAIRYWQAAVEAGLDVPADFAVFHQQYEWMSLQRNLRILGVFARLSLRDGKHHYLDHMPRLLQYVHQVASRYQTFSGLLRLLNRLEGRQTILGMTV